MITPPTKPDVIVEDNREIRMGGFFWTFFTLFFLTGIGVPIAIFMLIVAVCYQKFSTKGQMFHLRHAQAITSGKRFRVEKNEELIWIFVAGGMIAFIIFLLVCIPRLFQLIFA